MKYTKYIKDRVWIQNNFIYYEKFYFIINIYIFFFLLITHHRKKETITVVHHRSQLGRRQGTTVGAYNSIILRNVQNSFLPFDVPNHFTSSSPLPPLQEFIFLRRNEHARLVYCTQIEDSTVFYFSFIPFAISPRLPFRLPRFQRKQRNEIFADSSANFLMSIIPFPRLKHQLTSRRPS